MTHIHSMLDKFLNSALKGVHQYAHSGISCLSFFVISALFFLGVPEIDLSISNYFYDGYGYFPLNENLLVKIVYVGVPWLGRFLFFLALIIVLAAVVSPARLSRRHWRRAASMVVVVVLGVGFLVHTVLKDGMGRPRPRDVQAFAGSTSFVPVFTPSQFCATNCSFVSGHAAVGFSLMSLGMLGARRRRNFWFFTGLLTGSLIGFVRIAQGGHFLSDVIFSFVSIWAVHLLVRFVWVRFRAWQLFQPSDRADRLNAIQ